MIDTNVFIAAILAMAINLDRFGSGVSNHSRSPTHNRSPIGHSIGFAIIWIYLGFCLLYIAESIWAIPFDTGMFLALISAYWTHLFLDHIDGGIYSLPRTLEPGNWLRKSIAGSILHWPAWNRLSTHSSARFPKLSSGMLNLVLTSILIFFMCLAG